MMIMIIMTTTIIMIITTTMTASWAVPPLGTVSPVFPAGIPAAVMRIRYYRNKMKKARARLKRSGFCLVFWEVLCYNSDKVL